MDLVVLPGVSAAQAAAACVGAPLGHDFSVLSLSDNLKPWAQIVLGRDITRATERIIVTTLGEVQPAQVDMHTVVIVGSSQPRQFPRPGGGAWVDTPRCYPDAAPAGFANAVDPTGRKEPKLAVQWQRPEAPNLAARAMQASSTGRGFSTAPARARMPAMDTIPTPHDIYFRESFGRREVALDFLRAELPPGLLAEIALDSLTIAKDSYVSQELKPCFSDLVYRVRHKGGGLSIYLLFEHKSAPEYWTLLQLHRYIGAEGEQYRKQHPHARKLPPVYPMVIYHGKREWKAPAAFHDIVEPLPAALVPFVPSFTYRLVDLSERTDAEIKGAVLARLVQLALRWIYSDRPLARLRELLVLIGQIEDRETAVEILESLLRYYVQGTGRLDEPEVRQLLQQTPTGDPVMQTFIDRYIEQGRRQGEAAVLLRLIERKFGKPSEAVRERIVGADAETLLDWSERILTAESVEAVLH